MIKRFDPDWAHDSRMEEAHTGDYVLYEDYETLESDYNVLRRESLLLLEKQQAMMQRLKDIWVEG